MVNMILPHLNEMKGSVRLSLLMHSETFEVLGANLSHIP
jgi:hypothetical protein